MQQRNKGTEMTYKMEGRKGHRREDGVYNKVFYAIIPLSILGVHQRFVRYYCFHLQGISEKYLHTSKAYLFPPWTGYCRLLQTRCNRGFHCRSYCLLNMFRAPLCPSSGAQEYYTVVAACGISCCGFQVPGLVWSWGLCVRFAGCCSILQTRHITLSSTPDQQLENHSMKYHRLRQPLYNTLELLMMGIVVPETCWASNRICNKNLCCI